MSERFHMLFTFDPMNLLFYLSNFCIIKNLDLIFESGVSFNMVKLD